MQNSLPNEPLNQHVNKKKRLKHTVTAKCFLQVTIKDAQKRAVGFLEEMLSVNVPGERLYHCIFLVTGGVSERTPEDSASHHLSCGVE